MLDTIGQYQVWVAHTFLLHFDHEFGFAEMRNGEVSINFTMRLCCEKIVV